MIVEILIPGTDSCFDFQLPVQISIREAAYEISRIIETLLHNIYFDRDNLILCDMDRGYRLDPNTLVANARIRDGSRLMLL